MAEFELKLMGTRKTAVWEGEDGEDAARRYVDARRVDGGPPVTVIATRPRSYTNFIAQLVPGARFINHDGSVSIYGE